MLTFETAADGVLVVCGRFDASQVQAAQACLDGLSGTVTLDCGQLSYISSAGLGVLLKTQKRLLASGGKLRLVGVNRHLLDIFTYSGFDQILEVVPAQ